MVPASPLHVDLWHPENVIAAENGDLFRAVCSQPLADLLAEIAGVIRFVDDGMRRACTAEHTPRQLLMGNRLGRRGLRSFKPHRRCRPTLNLLER